MKVYVDIDDTRKITTYHDGLGTQQGLYVYGKDKIEVLSLADYAKQVRKEVCEEISYRLLDFSHSYWKVFKQNGKQYMTDDDLMGCLDEILDKMQGEDR